MNLYVFEDQRFSDFFPISSTRAVFDIRFGQSTFLERIIKIFPEHSVSLIVRDEFKELVSELHANIAVNPDNIEEGLWISSSVIWTRESVELLSDKDTAFMKNDKLVAANLSSSDAARWISNGGPLKSELESVKFKNIEVYQCNYLWDIIKFINQSINDDASELKPVDRLDYPHTNLINPDKIFINSAKVMPGALINAEKGPVIIDNNAVIYGQTYIEGPAFIGTDTVIKPLTKIVGSVIGKKCKIGGEVESSVIQGYSNKVHDGHLGDSFLGEWVNLGAGTSNSNLKNNYSSVKISLNENLIDTNSLHIGCFIGDHVKTAIGTLINTGTIIGAASMISTYGFPPVNLPPFSWYFNRKKERMDFDKFVSTAQKSKSRRNKNFTKAEKRLYKKISDY
ncbi:MAG: putative sugar nucleotidyl transferase [Candidatus Neomarinimicrobiota bacterium]